jgi:hypothetical protein
MTNLFSYTMKDDTGFAPHVDPTCRYLSLACCKPRIRESANDKDWVVGFGGKELSDKSGRNMVHRLVYAARISKVLDFDSYHSNPTLSGRVDNIYHSVDQKGKEWIQTSNPYHSKKNVMKDTKANRVLISDHFLYFGSSGPKLEEIGSQFSQLPKKGPNHKKLDLERDAVAKLFVDHLERSFAFNKCSSPTEEGRRKHCDDCDP